MPPPFSARGLAIGALACLATGCAPESTRPAIPPRPASQSSKPVAARAPSAACRQGAPLRVRFFNAGQALAVLVSLPDGRHLMVDAGESPTRAGCGVACKTWHQRVMDGLRADMDRGQLDLVWITHQHSDHLGGAPDVVAAFRPKVYVDNGFGLGKTKAVSVARDAARAAGSQVHVVDPEHPDTPFAATDSVTITAIVPRSWPAACPNDANACSLALRIDYCSSSILFTGDASAEEEERLDTLGPVTLLQAAHHGSDTSTSAAFLSRVAPKYAVVSTGSPNEGTNRTYCHPRASTIENLTRAMGGPAGRPVRAFDGRVNCTSTDAAEHWVDVPASDRLWHTARDGDVVLTTRGDGVFTRK